MGVEAGKFVQFDYPNLSVVATKDDWVNIGFQKAEDHQSKLIIYRPLVVAPDGQRLDPTRVQVASLNRDFTQSMEERIQAVDFLASHYESEGHRVDRNDLLRQFDEAAKEYDEMVNKMAGIFSFSPQRGGLYHLRLGVVDLMTSKFVEEVVSRVSVLAVPRHRYAQAQEEWEGQKRFGARSLGRRKKWDDYRVHDEHISRWRSKWANHTSEPTPLKAVDRSFVYPPRIFNN